MNMGNMNTKVMCLLTGFIIILALLNIFAIPYVGMSTLTGSYEQSHYLNISWHLWQQGNWIQLYDDAGLYTNKPPLLFWILKTFWLIFGANNWALRIIPSIFAIASLWLTAAAFKQLWPEYANLAWVSPALLLGVWDYFQNTPRFLLDVPLTFFVILAFYGLLAAIVKKWYGWWLYGLAIGLGVLTKGPIILIFTLIPAIIAPYFFGKKNIKIGPWFLFLLLSLLLAIFIVSLWLIPLFLSTNYTELMKEFYAKSMGLHHIYRNMPWWFYIVKLPPDLIPWTIWPFFYRAVAQQFIHTRFRFDPRVAFIFNSLIAIFIIMSLVPAKKIHYLTPLFFYGALFLGYCLINFVPTKPVVTRNRPFLILLIIVALDLLIAIFFQDNWRIHWRAFPPMPGYEIAMLGILLLLSVIFAWTMVKDIWTHSLLTQIALLFIVIALYTAFPMRVEVNLHRMPQFEKCVNNYVIQQQRPIAYFYHYGGYRFRVWPGMLPDGIILYNDQQVDEWQQQNPKGVIVATTQVPMQDKTILCATPIMRPVGFRLYSAQQPETINQN